MIDWDNFEKILKKLTKKQLIELYRWNYGKDALESRTKNQIIQLIFTENEGDIV